MNGVFFYSNLTGRRPHCRSNADRTAHHNPFDDGLAADVRLRFLQRVASISVHTNRAEHFCSAAHLYCCLFSCFTITFIELFDTATSLLSTLLTRKERMAFGANFNTQFRFRRTCFKRIAACASNFRIRVVLRMNTFFHHLHLFLYQSFKTYARIV